ncbi:MAG: hypothetical protein Ct9H300mP1_05810 [Planctomycetaceae bacterium]|nr:MAG: hypothetical protein Ct9H300mP1_05810 [Planctomycetaceae bacterium]
MTGRWRRQLNAVLVDVVPLDSRQSLYVRTGDWFAALCLLASMVIIVAGLSGPFGAAPGATANGQ